MTNDEQLKGGKQRDSILIGIIGIFSFLVHRDITLDP